MKTLEELCGNFHFTRFHHGYFIAVALLITIRQKNIKLVYMSGYSASYIELAIL